MRYIQSSLFDLRLTFLSETHNICTYTNKGSKDGNKGQGLSLLLCHHYLKRLLKINFKCLVTEQPKTEDKKK